jgi:hypothetical protein
MIKKLQKPIETNSEQTKGDQFTKKRAKTTKINQTSKFDPNFQKLQNQTIKTNSEQTKGISSCRKPQKLLKKRPAIILTLNIDPHLIKSSKTTNQNHQKKDPKLN